MKIKNFIDNTTKFLLKRLSELVGLILLGLSILLLISLISYSPEDPNFIFPENAEIKNLLGIKGSFTADILYQSIGLISLLIPISFFFISLSVIIDKKMQFFSSLNDKIDHIFNHDHSYLICQQLHVQNRLIFHRIQLF